MHQKQPTENQKTKAQKMKNSELVFIPSPGAGHLNSTLEIANLLIDRDPRLFITILIMKLPLETHLNSQTPTSTNPRLTFIDLPYDESSNSLISPHTFLSAYIEYHKPHVRDVVRSITESDSVQLVGFVVDMFCVAMMDVANEFWSPTYVYYTSGAAVLGLMFDLQVLRDEEGRDVTEFKDSDEELSVASYVNPVPVKVLPAVVLDKKGGANMFLDLALRFREAKGIMVNTFEELESHAVESLLTAYTNVPPVFPVGPILNLKSKSSDEIMPWLDRQPERSVVFLCFGSMGSFGEEQVKEIALALEQSGHRFLWSLRRPPPKEKIGFPGEYENPDEVLPEGLLERTSNVGKVIGWAPQVAVLSHPCVGGFVSHCGWNSTLESVWCGVPIAAWPVYAEQQMNAFQLVVELGMATEIKMDYRPEHGEEGSEEIVVKAEEIENGIRRLMSDEKIRKKVKEMGEKSRLATSEGGSSYISIGRFIDHVMINTP